MELIGQQVVQLHQAGYVIENIVSAIFYRAHRSFEEFINKQASKRLAAENNGDAIGAQLAKLNSNSFFGSNIKVGALLLTLCS